VPSSSRLEEIYSSLVVLVHHMSFHSPPAYHHLCDVNMCIIDIWVYCCDISWFVVSRMIDYLQISSSISSRRRFSSWDLSAGKAAEGFHFHFQICRDALPQISLNNLIAKSQNLRSHPSRHLAVDDISERAPANGQQTAITV
jgi:hypothetical protein